MCTAETARPYNNNGSEYISVQTVPVYSSHSPLSRRLWRLNLVAYSALATGHGHRCTDMQHKCKFYVRL